MSEAIFDLGFRLEAAAYKSVIFEEKNDEKWQN